ncbi:Putative Zn-dependent protease, contains TPR repeats [Allopseudospirillum japonicum]|uniref:Zn-dependent protease, contains TPR repeats n=1 Tax=Allopseudospirillum japonicum TaxID=64971 RepID=A0A1H6R832_9GAMM|nr:M48 family metalloprotease [Allopseudospirillum japonicum]SEI51893.1 Putative Zn-dependent protease, contains TPR repeats [Allopseudospirillum japonicum]
MFTRCYLCLGWVLAILVVGLGPLATAKAQADLPALGSPPLYSAEQQRLLGQAWLRQFRQQAQVHYDPLVQDYSETLLKRLSSYTPMTATQLQLLVVAHRQLNAFAVPGQIIGIHSGLFTFAPTEAEFASVLAHELGHLSQEHFVRRLQQAQANQGLQIASVLAGIALSAAGEPQAGIAAMSSGQAAGIQQSLSYSRLHEQEADRIGLETLAAAGFDPEAMPKMFTRLQQHMHLQGEQGFEFLRTHPLSESRIADTQNHAAQVQNEQQNRPKSALLAGWQLPTLSPYALMRARILVALEGGAEVASARLQSEAPDLAEQKAHLQTYIQALAALPTQATAAIQGLQALLKQYPEDLNLQTSLAEAYFHAQNYPAAEQILSQLLALAPNYYPALWWYGRTLMQTDPTKAYPIWQALSRQRPQDPHIWYQTAEAAGLAGDTLGVHQARAEYFQLHGRWQQAFKHLQLAQQISTQASTQAALAQRIRSLQVLQTQMQALLDGL